MTSTSLAEQIGAETRIDRATHALLALQKADGHFVFELEADATIPAEYVLLVHHLAETPDLVLERKIGNYLRRIQGRHGGWPLFHDGALDVSASVKAYFALKMIGDDPQAPHMRRAREAIHRAGGAEKSNVFTRILLALYGQVPWHAVPVVPVEVMLLPKWFPFHIDRISYWARTVLVPLTVITGLKPRAANPRNVDIAELFLTPPDKVRQWPGGAHQKRVWKAMFSGIDAVLQRIEPHAPKALRRRAIDKAEAFTRERLNGEDGLGAIYPAMANAVMMYAALGHGPDYEPRRIARHSIEKLLVIREDEAYCQPCVSPVWDTALAAHALLEAEAPRAAISDALDWLGPRQILDVRGDWIARRPDVRPGGWAFQYNNPHYPDLDDTAVVVMAMDRAQRGSPRKYDPRIERATEWVTGLQSRNGGWGAFDADNNDEYLNNIPFADHGALLDPPTADVSARCLSMLAQLGRTPDRDAQAKRALEYLVKEQEADGSWYGRWGMNYIYGTWSALCALNAAGLSPEHPAVRSAAAWLERIQNGDGGWGEGGESYKLDYAGYEQAPSTPSQTAWALLALMAAGHVNSTAVSRGIHYLLREQDDDGLWSEERYTATGFPRVFYLRYHGYAKYFPLWALARWRNLRATNSKLPAWGM